MPADKQAEMVQRMMSFGRIGIEIQAFLIPVFLLIGGLFSAVVMLIANAISRGDGTFKTLFRARITVAVVSSSACS